MAFRAVSVICAFVAFVQVASSQYLNAGLNNGCGCNSYGLSQASGNNLAGSGLGFAGNSGFAGNGINLSSNLGAASGSPSFGVTSSTSNNPNGIAVLSNNDIAGEINVCGGLPFASAVAFESAVPTAGEASLNYGCGNNVALNSAGNGIGNGFSGNIGQGFVGNGISGSSFLGSGLIGGYNGRISGSCGCA